MNYRAYLNPRLHMKKTGLNAQFKEFFASFSKSALSLISSNIEKVYCEINNVS